MTDEILFSMEEDPNDLAFELGAAKADQFEDKEAIRQSMMSTGLIESDDWDDNHFPDYYLLGC